LLIILSDEVAVATEESKDLRFARGGVYPQILRLRAPPARKGSGPKNIWRALRTG
jgi:hypothetical protein